jgi:dTDP-4-amino-4,6-dideoxygalactose transaminase
MDERIGTVDLAGEYAEVGSEVEAAVLGVLRSSAYVLGPECKAFEAELAGFVGADFAVGAASGTDALVLALRAVGVEPGSEVVTTPFTFFATAEAILQAGARPVFADIEPHGFNLDPAALDAAINERTRAIVPVHLFGACADLDAIGAVASARSVPVVEDAAQAIGAVRGGRRAGSVGAAAAFSFYPSKNLSTAGDGGAVTTCDSEVAERVRLLGNHGSRERDHHVLVGTTSRLDALQAAILRVKLRHLPRWNRARREVASGYSERLAGLDGVELPCVAADETPVWHQYAVRCRPSAQRASVCKALEEAGVEWRHFYPRPVYRQPGLGEARLPAGACPEAERACDEVICLPIHPRLRSDELDRVADAVRRGAAG